MRLFGRAALAALALLAAQTAAAAEGAPRPAAAPGLEGDWDGAVDIGGARLRVVFHIKNAPGQGLAATFDSVDQNQSGLPLSAVSREGDKVVLDLKLARLRFEGALSPDGRRLSGTLVQGPSAHPLDLIRRAPGAPLAYRPQTPVPPFPYREERVTYANPAAEGVRLAGTLTLPEGKGPFPAVVLISGSGANNRDEEAFGHKLFLVLADHLTRRGLAVLRFDKRGVGESTGDFAKATSRDFAGDVRAAVAFLRGRRDIDARRIGLIGHSEGGIIAPLVAADDHKLAFIVLMAGPGEKIADLMRQQRRLVTGSTGMPQQMAADNAALAEGVIAALAPGKDPVEGEAEVRRLVTEFGKAHGLPDAVIENQIRAATSPWYRSFIVYDPAPVLKQVDCPVLAINGSKDMQVPARENLDGIRAALAGKPDVTVQELPGLNHLFQEAPTGAPAEYRTIEQTMSPSALDMVAGWIAKRVGVRR